METQGRNSIVERKSVLEAEGPDIGNVWRDIKMSIKALLGKIAQLKSFTAVLAAVAHCLFTHKRRRDNTRERL